MINNFGPDNNLLGTPERARAGVGMTTTTVGPLTVWPPDPDEDHWTVSGDVRHSDDDSTYDVEDKVREAIKAHGLYPAVSTDSEHSCFFAYAPDEALALRVATIVVNIIGPPPPPDLELLIRNENIDPLKDLMRSISVTQYARRFSDPERDLARRFLAALDGATLDGVA